jgi:hypothetical protein
MAQPFLNEGDSFALAGSQADKTKAFFFRRRVGHQVSSEMSDTFFLTLRRLGISDNCDSGDITDADVKKLDAATESMAELIAGICRRKAG